MTRAPEIKLIPKGSHCSLVKKEIEVRGTLVVCYSSCGGQCVLILLPSLTPKDVMLHHWALLLFGPALQCPMGPSKGLFIGDLLMKPYGCVGVSGSEVLKGVLKNGWRESD